jgi:Ni/Co efflux regulator RcnB
MERSEVCAALLVISIAVLGITAAPAFADKTEHAGKGKGHDKSGRHDKDKGHNAQDSKRDDRGPDRRRGSHFSEPQRVAVHEYYEEQFQSRKRCPPGLAKKRNGCMPPGQAKKWKYGKPLPASVVYYDLPPQLVVQLPRAPQGHKYVRVAGDILLIAIGSAMVIDAIEDLGRM